MEYGMYFEDFTEGQVFEYGGETIIKAEIFAFAARYDPEPFHLSDETAEKTIFGGVIASGLQTLALWRRMDHEFFTPRRAAFLVAAGLEEVNWVQPGRPGDVLSVRCEVLEKIPSRSKPDRGIVRFGFQVRNQHDALLMVFRNKVMVGRRPAQAE
jgi:acyl dehydratase